MLRTCSACGLIDDHPRHVWGAVSLGGVKTPQTSLHLDCCAHNGCATCLDTLVAAGGRTGQDLIDHLAAERAARTLED